MAAPMRHASKKFLLQFAHEHIDFKLAELKAIARLFRIPIGLDEGKYDEKNPFLVVALPSENDARRIMGRSVLAKSLFELWATAGCQDDLHRQLQMLPKDFVKPYLSEDLTYRIRVDAFNRSLSPAEKLERINALPEEALNFQGKVNLKSPDQSFHLLEYYEYEAQKSTKGPVAVYFGRWVTDGKRELIKQFDLKVRHFIGNTSMDPTLSLIMANLAEIKANHLVFDPFVGTGSLLVPCAHFGAYVLGTDIDYLVIHGKGRSSRHKQKFRGPDENIRANLRQYSLEKFYLDAMLADASGHDMWRQHELFDAIVTDPPYGIRESARRIGTEKEEVILTEENKDGHIPQRVNYDLSDIFKDLLNFAAKFLRIHGRLVYWLPVYRPEYSPENIPRHPCMELRSNCEQPLSVKVSRRLITMEKTREYCECAERHGARVAKDHYQGATFRERYFKPARKQSHDQQKLVAMETNCDLVEGNRVCMEEEPRNGDDKASVQLDRDRVESAGMDSDDKVSVKMDRDRPAGSADKFSTAGVAEMASINKETFEMGRTNEDNARIQMETSHFPKQNTDNSETPVSGKCVISEEKKASFQS